MFNVITCPNCSARMEVGDKCQECDHDDGDPFCDCESCCDQLGIYDN